MKPIKNKNFWTKIHKPFFVLAPMANVTDAAFRKMIAKYGKPDVMWTEFVSADGLLSSGRKKLLIDLKYSENERPIVAQLFTGNPEVMQVAAQLVAKQGFDGIDINMGCPDRSVEKQGGGAAMMKDSKKALAVLAAAREGWDQSSGCDVDHLLPISVKTRIGYSKLDMKWIELLLRQNLPSLTVHLRTRKEMSDVGAHWELMKDIVKMRDDIYNENLLAKGKLANKRQIVRTLIIGNGDIESLEQAREKIRETGCDGVMIGRGIFGKPWFFSDSKSGGLHIQKTPKERLKIILEHATTFEKMFGGTKRSKNFAVMKKHFKAYVSGWDGAKELRVKLMESQSLKEVKQIVKEYMLE